MNILMIYRNNPLETSGAVTLDLFYEFRKRGHKVCLLVNKFDTRYPEGVVSMETKFIHWKDRAINKIKRTLRLEKHLVTNPKYHFHEADETKMFYSTKSILQKAGMKPDAVIVLFAKNFVNTKNLQEIYTLTRAPVYWMMYDTAPLTGGCHYSWDCTGYHNACGSCPGLYSNDPNDITHRNMLFKQKHIDQTDISLVIASKWQEEQAMKSSLFRNKAIHKIFISINPDVFFPLPAAKSREPFNIPDDKKVMFFGAYFLNHERKGIKYLIEALQILKARLKDEPELDSNILLLIAGMETDKVKPMLPFEHKDLGMLNNSTGVASAYQAADIFLCPSIEDAGPSMVNQSIMCGTPVVAFNQGVAMDIVISGDTGYRARLMDASDFAEGMYRILKLNPDELSEMKQNCRRLGLQLLDPERSTEQWLQMVENNQA